MSRPGSAERRSGLSRLARRRKLRPTFLFAGSEVTSVSATGGCTRATSRSARVRFGALVDQEPASSGDLLTLECLAKVGRCPERPTEPPRTDGMRRGPKGWLQARALAGLNGGGRVGAIDKPQPDKRLAVNGSEGRSRSDAGDEVGHPLDPVRSGQDRRRRCLGARWIARATTSRGEEVSRRRMRTEEVRGKSEEGKRRGRAPVQLCCRLAMAARRWPAAAWREALGRRSTGDRAQATDPENECLGCGRAEGGSCEREMS
jgi:hypothetical protein